MDEEIENQLEERSHILNVLGMDYSAYEEFRLNVTNGLLKFGGSFSQALGTALAVADNNNAAKIIRYWHQDCEHHAHLFRMYVAKLKAEHDPNIGCP